MLSPSLPCDIVLRSAAAAAVLSAIVILFPAEASKPALDMPPPSIKSTSPVGPVEFARIEQSTPDLVLSLEGAKATISRAADAREITLASNCPGNWNVSGHVVKQVGMSTAQKGVSLRADASGGHVTVNGKVYQLPRDADGAIRNLKVQNGEVLVNGRKLEPLAGSEKPGACTGPDILEVTVPESYKGNLILMSRGTSRVHVDSWKGGSLTANLTGASALTTGKLDGLEKAAIDVQGGGTADIKDLSARAFVANINGAGSVSVQQGSADMSNATISGTGSMKLHGKFKNLKKSISGIGTIEVIE